MKNLIKIQVQIAVFKRREYWIAYSPALKTYGYSKHNVDEALEDFDIAINTFVHVHTKLNSLNQVLLDLGWTRNDKSFEVPKFNIASLGELRGIKSTSKNREVLIPN